MTGLYASTRRSDRVNTPPAPPPDPEGSFGDIFGASMRTTVDDIPSTQEGRLVDGYRELVDELEALGVSRAELRGASYRAARAGIEAGQINNAYGAAAVAGGTGIDAQFDRDAIWRAVARLSSSRPALVAERGATREEFERRLLTRDGARAVDQRVIANSSGVGATVAAFSGSMLGSFADPVNVATLPLGGGAGSLARIAGREFLINSLIETVQQPRLEQARLAMGETLTGEDAAINILTAGAGGAVLGAGGVAIGRMIDNHGGAVARAVGDGTAPAREAALARVYPLLPERFRQRWADASSMPDHVLADALEEMAGERLTPDQGDVIASVRREADVTPDNPFVPNAAGQAMFSANMQDAMARVLRDSPLRPVALPTSISPRARLRSGTSAGSDIVNPARGSAARQALKTRIGVAESSGGRAWANPRSSARGLYQFIDSTWLAYYARRYGPVARGQEAAVLAMRRDTRMQNILMDDLLEDNARFLVRQGEAETAGNLYLVHFAGQGGARRLFEADASAPVRDVLGAGVVNANPFLRNMSAGDVIAWAHRRMSDTPPPRADGRARSARDDYDDPAQDALAREIERLEAERARLDSEAAALDREAGAPDDMPDAAMFDDGAARIADIVDDDVPVSIADALPDLRLPRAERAPDVPGAAPDMARLEPVMRDLRTLVETTKVDLNDMTQLVRRLDASEADIRQSLAQLALQKVVVTRAVRQGRGRSARVVDQRYVRPPARRRPRDPFELIAAHGGLRDSGRDDLATIFQNNRGGSKFVPGFGPLLRRTGMSLDEAGELLADHGFLHGRDYDGSMGRATVAEILQYLEDLHHGGRRGRTIADDLAREDWNADGRYSEREIEIGNWSAENGYPTDDDIISEMADIVSDAIARGEPLRFEDAYVRLANRELMDVAIDIWQEVSDDAEYSARIADILDADGVEGGSGRTAFTGDPRAGGASGEDAASREAFYERWDIADDGWRADDIADDGAVWRDTNSGQDWIDPAGTSAKEQAASLTHDVGISAGIARGDNAPEADASDLFGGASRDEARQALERRMEGGMSSGVEQRPAGSDGGLFDQAAFQQADFILDENGDVRNVADIIADLDADDAVLRDLRDCL